MKSDVRGAYFLADDGVWDLALAFLNSFRRHNPDIRLCLIPFSANISRLKELQNNYGFSIYQNTELLNICDDISLCFHGKPLGHYRKLAAWQGEFEEFIYVDVDTVVLDNIDFAFKFISKYDFVASHSNMRHIVKCTWKESIYKTGELPEEAIGYAANTGFIVSKKGAIALKEVKEKAEYAVRLLPDMELRSKEQAFLNYLIVTSGRKYTSLFCLWQETRSPDIKLEQWAGTTGRKVRNGQIVFKPHPVFLVHWAGKWTVTWFDKMLFSILKAFRIKEEDDEPVTRFFMPYKRLWRHYRFMREDART
jgi:hypothetical protein